MSTKIVTTIPDDKMVCPLPDSLPAEENVHDSVDDDVGVCGSRVDLVPLGIDYGPIPSGR